MSKLIIATPLYPPEIGGPATFSKIIEEELPKQAVEVQVVKFSNFRGWPSVARHLAFSWAVFRAARAGGTVLALDPLGIGLPAYFAARLAGAPFFLRVVGDRAWEACQLKLEDCGLQNLDEFQTKRHGFLIEFRKKLQRFVAARAVRVIVPSEYLKKIVTKWGIKERQIEVVYNSFKSLPYNLTREQSREELKLSGRIIVSAGRLVPWKGMDALIDIMPDIRQEIPNAQLFIVGEGPEMDNLRLKIEDLRLEGQVKLLGRLPQGELYRYIKAADVFVLNTGYEGLSHQLLEVMALGTPVVTTNVGGNLELFEDEKNGLLVDYNNGDQLKNAIIRLLFDEDIADNLTKGSQSQIAKFGTDKMISGLLEVLKIQDTKY